MINAESIGGEWRLVDGNGSIVAPWTEQDGFNGRILRALRTAPEPPERDSLGYVWPDRSAVFACLYKSGAYRR